MIEEVEEAIKEEEAEEEEELVFATPSRKEIAPAAPVADSPTMPEVPMKKI